METITCSLKNSISLCKSKDLTCTSVLLINRNRCWYTYLFSDTKFRLNKGHLSHVSTRDVSCPSNWRLIHCLFFMPKTESRWMFFGFCTCTIPENYSFYVLEPSLTKEYLKLTLLYLLLLLPSSPSLLLLLLSQVFFFPNISPENQWWTPPLSLQVSNCSTFLVVCDLSSMAVFCIESIKCFHSIVSRIFFV
jgi:hypothetical protein